MQEARVGDRVSYGDMANPRKTGTVVQVLDGFFTGSFYEYVVRFDDGEEATSDLRQHGWRQESGNITYTVAIMLLVVLPAAVFVTHALNTLGGALR